MRFTKFFSQAAIATALLATAAIARADDEKSTKAVDQHDKEIKASASKLDLSTPASNLKFYGDATVGYVAAIGKSSCGTSNSSGPFYQVHLGTDIKLSNDALIGVQVVVGQGPNCFLLR